MPKKQVQKDESLIRMLGYMLGVHPDSFGLVPDEEGWVSIKELLKAMHEEDGWRGVRGSMVRQAAERLSPETLQIDGSRIRALDRQPNPPEYGVVTPAHLYIAVRERIYPVIRENGLASSEGRPVVLVADEDHALRLGRRKDPQPVLVTVQARKAGERGVAFALFGEALYLCDQVPPDCLMGPPVPEQRPAAKKPAKDKPAAPRPLIHQPVEPPGSFSLFPEEEEKSYKRKGIKKDIAWKRERRRGRRNVDDED